MVGQSLIRTWLESQSITSGSRVEVVDGSNDRISILAGTTAASIRGDIPLILIPVRLTKCLSLRARREFDSYLEETIDVGKLATVLRGTGCLTEFRSERNTLTQGTKLARSCKKRTRGNLFP